MRIELNGLVIAMNARRAFVVLLVLFAFTYKISNTMGSVYCHARPKRQQHASPAEAGGKI